MVAAASAASSAERPAQIAAADTKQASEPIFFVGWDPEREAAWRLQFGDPAASKEFTQVLVYPDDAPDDSVAFAKWSDGFEHELVAVTVGQLKARKQCLAAPLARALPLWSNHDGSLQVRFKEDRTKLVWLREKLPRKAAKQMCQAATVAFKSEADAVQMMTTLAQEYSEQKITKGQLYARRDELMQQAGVGPARRGVAASPAVAAPSTPKAKLSKKAKPSACGLDFSFDEDVLLGMDEYAALLMQ